MKIILPFLLLPVAFGRLHDEYVRDVAVRDLAIDQSLATLEANWKIDALTLSPQAAGDDSLTINAPHNGGDGVTQPLFRIYIPTEATSNPKAACVTRKWKEELFDLDSSNPYVSPVNNNGFETTGYSVGLGAGTSTWTFNFAEGIEDNALAYLDNAVEGQPDEVIFCVLFGLRKPPNTVPSQDPDRDIINFREIAIKVTLSFDGNFVVKEAFDVQPFAILQDLTGTADYGVTSEICIDDAASATKVIRSGDVVPLCVCADDYPLTSVIGYEDLTFREYKSTGVLSGTTLTAYGGGLIPGSSTPIVQFLGCGEIAKDSAGDDLPKIKQCCRVDTLLDFWFNDRNHDAHTKADAFGLVTLDVGGARRLAAISSSSLGQRALETTEEREFETEFVLAESGAVTNGFLAAAGVAMMSAAALVV